MSTVRLQRLAQILLVSTPMFLCLSTTANAALVTDATALWTPITYPGANQTDYFDDQQTGNSTSSSDLVGNATDPAFFTQFDNGGDDTSLTDGRLMFRARLGAPGGNSTPVFDRNLFVGIDANQDGALDLYLGVHHQGSSEELAIYGPGGNLNVSPNTTSITGPLATVTEVVDDNYRYAIVDSVDMDLDADGETDYHLSFAVDFQTIVDYMLSEAGLTIDENTVFSYVMATATQDNSFNQDLNGVPKTFDSTATWSSIGAMSNPFTASGESAATPEPSSLAFMGLASLFGAIGSIRRRRRKNA